MTATTTFTNAELQSALAYAVRKAAEDESPETQCAWLTRFCVWALYPAIYSDIKAHLQPLERDDTRFPDQHELLEQLLQAGLIATPRAVAVREHRFDGAFSQLNMALEMDPDLIWRPGASRPALTRLTHAMGPYLRQAADLMGLPSSPADQPQLRLGTLHSIPQSQADQWPVYSNPRVTLAIYWQPEELAPEGETRRISK
ncbi:uncharacterized protein HELO_4067A [Halomonas elongata DSM 2581]|uniref:Uncharacterized protein n=1 Tax=Halomonas elongata (strain ATCC 33173 / DSM 2581 / NBRC 15536 / NCIMB 2198 / 1H9) TaxID=768066 RepID=A0A1R4A4I2_HALED|nr:uncharacterized protein HELO_4067A [Halomonas elongata DSM 2581]